MFVHEWRGEVFDGAADFFAVTLAIEDDIFQCIEPPDEVQDDKRPRVADGCIDDEQAGSDEVQKIVQKVIGREFVVADQNERTEDQNHADHADCQVQGDVHKGDIGM